MEDLKPKAPEAVDAAFARGAGRVLLRGPGGPGLDAAVSSFVRAKAAEGRVLVLVPHANRAAFEAALKAAWPTLAVGGWDDDAIVEVTAPTHAGARAATRLPETFAWIVVEECHAANAAMIDAVLRRFEDARILEVSRQAAPAPGNVEGTVEAALD